MTGPAAANARSDDRHGTDLSAVIGRLAVKAPRALYSAAGTVFSFETILVLFMFAGVYKGDPRFAGLPFDITAVAFALSVLTGLYLLWRNGFTLVRYSAQVLWLYGAFTAWALITLAWTPSHDYAQDKALFLCTLIFWPLAAGALIIAPRPVRWRRFFLVLLLFAGWIAVESLLYFAINTLLGRRFAFVHALSGTYLSLGRVIGPGLLVIAAVVLFVRTRWWQKLLLAGLAVGFLGVLMVLGGRTPLVAAVLSCCILLLGLRPRLARTPLELLGQFTLVVIGIAALAALVGYVAGAEVYELPASLKRLMLLFEGTIPTNRRFEHYALTFIHLDNNPWLGQGLGSWPVVVGIGDYRAYPHNILLEIWFELGLVGLALFSTLIALALAALGPFKRLRTSPYALLALALFVNAFLNAMVSGDLNDNRPVFAMLGLCLLAGSAYAEQRATPPAQAAQSAANSS
ncbi:O-antigen ligase family protein [bacterium]|nr:O-antigen ligase family protein [bacterium]